MSYTPVILIIGAVALVAAWRLNLLGRLRGNAGPGRVATAASTRPSDLDGYDSTTLGLAYHRAIRREAEDEVARQNAEANRKAAMDAYMAPFSPGGQGPPPPS